MAIWTSEIKELEKLYESFKGQLPNLEKELGQLIKSEDANVILLYSRRCLEVIITDLCECELKRPRKTEPLKGIIDKLHKDEKVPAHIISSMQGLNELSTYGAHPKDYDPDQVKPVLVNLDIIIKWYLKYKDSQIVGKLQSREEKNESKQPAVLPPKKSIIVLPFENMSPDPDQEYFSDGLTEEIITDLSNIHDLLVISRSSAMTFKGTNKTIPEIAQAVNVRYVLEGSVRKAANNLRITAQLIDAENDSHIWAEKYTGTMDDIFDIQEKVSCSIFNALKLKLTPEENHRISEKPITNVLAYEYYLQAKHKVWSFNQESLDHALRLINKALDNVGDNALLYATRALIYWQYHNAGFKPNEEILIQADNEAGKALEIDPELSLGHWAKGAIAYTRGELQTAALQYKRSAELESGGESLAWLSLIFALAGRMKEARQYGDQAVSIDPLNILTLGFRGLIEIYGGDFKCAVSWLKKGLEVMPEDPMTLGFYAISQLFAGNREESLALLLQLESGNAGLLSSLGAIWRAALCNDVSAFRKSSNEMKEYAKGDKEMSWSLADCSAILGETDEALDWLSNSIERGLINDIFFSEFDPFLNTLKNIPRFKTLMEGAREKQRLFIVVNN